MENKFLFTDLLEAARINGFIFKRMWKCNGLVWKVESASWIFWQISCQLFSVRGIRFKSLINFEQSLEIYEGKYSKYSQVSVNLMEDGEVSIAWEMMNKHDDEDLNQHRLISNSFERGNWETTLTHFFYFLSWAQTIMMIWKYWQTVWRCNILSEPLQNIIIRGWEDKILDLETQ